MSPLTDRAIDIYPESIGKISSNFDGHWLRGYVRGKLRNDPVYAESAAIVAAFPAPVLDIGCGPGLLAHYLDACDIQVPYHGLDADERKITSARAAGSGLANACFEQADCLPLPDWRGHVMMLDMLHYLDTEKQTLLVRTAISRIAPGASLTIRTVIRDRSWRFHVTRVEEAVIRSSRWIRGGVQHYPRIDELSRPLDDAGLAVETLPMFGHTPFNSHLIRATRPRES